MSEVCFNVDVRLSEKPLPKCEFYEYSDQYFGRETIRIDDLRLEEKLQIAKKKYYVHKVESSNHYFSNVGFPQCIICGWSP